MPNFGKAFNDFRGRRTDNVTPAPSSVSSLPPAPPAPSAPPHADVAAARFETLEQRVRSLEYLPRNMQNLRSGLGISNDVEEGLVRKGGLVRTINNIDRDLGKNETETRDLQDKIKTKAEKEEVTNLARRVKEIEEAREIEGRERRAEKEELDQLRYFAEMEQAIVAYIQEYRQKYGGQAVPPSMSMATTSMASLPSFAGIGTSTPRRHIEAGPSTWTIASAPTVTELTSEGETEIIERCMAEAEASHLKRCRESEREDDEHNPKHKDKKARS